MYRLAFLALLLALSLGGSQARPASLLSGSVTRSYSAGSCDSQFFCWICKGPVALDSVTVSVETNAAAIDAVKLQKGCTGEIGSLNVVTSSADGVKIAEGAHDLTIDGGSVRCLDKTPVVHQDAVQAMGGANVTFADTVLDCGRVDAALVDSDFFVNEAGASTQPPSGILCERCVLGPYAAHTVNLEASTASGIADSVICSGKYPNLTFTVGPDALDPVDEGNLITQAC